MQKHLGLWFKLLISIIFCGILMSCAESVPPPSDPVENPDPADPAGSDDPNASDPIESPGVGQQPPPTTTDPALVAPAFAIQFTDPDHGLGNMSITSNIKVSFNQAVNPATVTTNTLWLHDMVTHKKIEADVVYDPTTRSATLTPSALEYEGHYLLIAHRTIKDIAGNNLERTYEFSFFTESRPAVFGLFPENGSTGVNINSVARVSFEKLMNRDSITPTSFLLQDSQGTFIPASVVASETDATLFPEQPLTPNTLYHVILNNTLQLADGSAFSSSEVRWQFTTAENATISKQFGTVGYDAANKMVIDSANNIILVGKTDNAMTELPNQGGDDVVIAKFDANHALVWQQQIGTVEYDAAFSAVVDAEDNIYVFGETTGALVAEKTAQIGDVFVIKLNSAGEQQWIAQLGSESGWDGSSEIFYQNGQLILVGSTEGVFDNSNPTLPSSREVYIASVDAATGVLISSVQVPMGDSLSEVVADVTVDTIYIAFKKVTLDTVVGQDKTSIEVLAYDFAQSQLWSQSLQENGVIYENIEAIAVAGNKILLSVFKDIDPAASESIGTYLLALDTTTQGNLLWQNNLFPNVGNILHDIVVDVDGNYFLAGYEFSKQIDVIINPEQPVFVAKYDASDTLVWSSGTIDSGEGFVKISAVLLDSSGVLHMAGTVNGGVAGNTSLGNDDFFLAAFDAATGTQK